jgi:CO/xanthine dehydrogenase Mo-binding subunit
MTEMLNSDIVNREFTRKNFVRGGGMMIVAMGVGAAGVAGKAQAAESPFASNGPPDLQAVDSFIAIHADNTVSVKTGRVELGQGSNMGLMMIAAEELDMDIGQMIFVRHDTNVTPNTGGTFGSSSIASAGPRIRSAAATAKQALLGLAATQLGVPVSSLTVSKGVVSGGGRSVTYGQLLGDKVFNVRMASATLNPGVAPAKPISQYQLVTKVRVPRVDIPDKVTGKYTYVHNIRVPGMLHGRLVRPRGQGAYGDGTMPRIVSVDESSIKHIPGARVVRRNDFLGVVAPTEYAAIQAAAQLKVQFAEPPAISGSGNLWKQMRQFDSAGQAPARIAVNTGNFNSAYASAPIKVEATYKYPYNGHMPLGPAAAVAHVTSEGALVMTGTQDAYTMRGRIATLLNLPINKVRIQYWESGGTFGNAQVRHDTGQAAAVMSQLAGAPVRLVLMRWDEHGWDNYGPAIMADMRAAVDASGKIVAYEFTGFGMPAIGLDPTTQHVGTAIPTPGTGALDTTNSGTQYNIPNRRVIGKTLPLINNYFKTSTLRAPQAPQTTFCSEGLIDELAYAAKMDPYEFRLKNISTTDQNRWRDVLVGVGKLANWQPKVAASNLSNDDVVRGRGLGLGSYAGSQAGVVADVEVNKKTGKIRVLHAYVTQVSGLGVSIEGLESQMMGSMMMGSSRTLYETVPFDKKRVTGLDWVTYPILRFKDAPNITYTVTQRLDLPSTGAGEPPDAAIPAAIANAFFDATGVRIRETPLTPARVRAVLKAAGK